MSFRKEKVNSLLKEMVSSFIGSNSEPGVIITVTDVDVASNLRYAKILISVFPETKESEMLAKLNRKKSSLTAYIKPKLKMKFLPHFDIKIDVGEKNRQRAEEALAS
jgi:ribosome-binding factor A